MDLGERDRFWANFLMALNTEPRPDRSITGASGVSHSLLGLGIDEKEKRLILISDDISARNAALMQIDVQFTLPNVRVIVARSIATDLSDVAKKLIAMAGGAEIDLGALVARHSQLPQSEQQQKMNAILSPILDPMFAPFRSMPMRALPYIQQIISQLGLLDWGTLFQEQGKAGRIRLDPLAETDVTALDRDFGICAVPLFQCVETDVEVVKSGTSVDDIAELLKRLGIYQYFFPAPDHAALGLVARGVKARTDITTQIQNLPKIGHPLGQSELTAGIRAVRDLLDALQDRGLAVEADVGFELTETGMTARATVKGRPREAAISKLLNFRRIGLSYDATGRVGVEVEREKDQ